MRETGRAGRGFRRLLKVVAVEALVIILLGAAIGGWVGLSVSGHDPRLLLYVGLRVDAVQVTRGPDQPYARVAPSARRSPTPVRRRPSITPHSSCPSCPVT